MVNLRWAAVPKARVVCWDASVPTTTIQPVVLAGPPWNCVSSAALAHRTGVMQLPSVPT